MFEAIRRVVAETGVLTARNKRVLDSTVWIDAVVTADTVTMITAQIRKCRRLIAQARGSEGFPRLRAGGQAFL